MNAHRYFAYTLARICLQSPWEREPMAEAVELSLQGQGPWVNSLIRQVLHRFPRRPGLPALFDFLRQSEGLAAIRLRYQPRICRYPLTWPHVVLPPSLPPLDSVGVLCEWLRLTPADLDWFADRNNRAAAHTRQKVRHYHVTTISKRQGGMRLLEVPKSRLKQIQRRIHDDILLQLPLHAAAQGFVRGRTPVAHAGLHVGQAVVLRFDLRDCFLHVHGGRVFQAFRALGFPDDVSRLLMGLCTHRLPQWLSAQLPLDETQRQKARQNHLPQGAPSSPLLSHFALRGVDVRLSAYASALGATYSRYADDLVLSGGEHLRHRFRAIEARAGAIVAEEGFALNFRKSRCVPAAQRQQVTGVVVNQQLNIPRVQFDALKAELHNCVQQGWVSQRPAQVVDYRAHLLGRIGWVMQVNPQRGAKLRGLFERIDW